MIIGNNWYDLNAQRSYPLDDVATAVDDAGQMLPSDILVDLTLRWPVATTTRAVLAAVTVTPRLVSLIFAASAGYPALAALTLPQPVEPYRSYPLTPLSAGVGGWAVLGPGVDTAYSGRFSTSSQSILCSASAQSYHPATVRSIAREASSSPLVGTVGLIGAGDLTITRETVTVLTSSPRSPGVDATTSTTPAIVLQLQEDPTRDVYGAYIGPCGGRPESETCATPVIERINGVTPDANGQLTIRMHGMTMIPFTSNQGGASLVLPLNLSTVCDTQSLSNVVPDYADRCESSSSSLISSSSSSSSLTSSSSSLHISSSSSSIVCWHGNIDIDFAGGTAHWKIISGDFVADESTWTSVSTGTRNVAVLPWDQCVLDTTLDHTVSATFQLKSGSLQSNGGVVLNYYKDQLTGLVTYLLAVANARTNSLELWRFNGIGLSLLTSNTLSFDHPLHIDVDYTLSATAMTSGTGLTHLVITLTRPEADGPGAVLETLTNLFGSPHGWPGIGSIGSIVSFTHFSFIESS